MSSSRPSKGKAVGEKKPAKKPARSKRSLAASSLDIDPVFTAAAVKATQDRSGGSEEAPAEEASAAPAVHSGVPAADVAPVEEPAAESAPEPVEAASEVVERAAPAAAKRPARQAGSAKPKAATQGVGADPLVQELNGRVYVLVGEDLTPEGARTQMTIALTVMERHRWSRYAEARRMPMIDVLRERMAGIFSGEDE